MKSITFAALQVLLIILPIVSVSELSSEVTESWSDEETQTLEPIGPEDDVREIPVTMPKICWGSPRSCLDVKTTVKISRKGVEAPKKTRRSEKGSHSHSRVCYRNIRIKMTEKCSQHQPIDFSKVLVRDFCLGEYAELAGDITIFYPISSPFSIQINMTQISDRKGESSLRYGGNVHIFTADGCKLFGEILCSKRRSEWCGCPIPSGVAPLFRARVLAGADFLPLRFGSGKFVGKAVFQYAKGPVCAEFSFDRVKIRTKSNVMEN